MIVLVVVGGVWIGVGLLTVGFENWRHWRRARYWQQHGEHPRPRVLTDTLKRRVESTRKVIWWAVVVPIWFLSALLGVLFAVGGNSGVAAVCGFVFVGNMWVGGLIGKMPDDR